jgi:GNAT superfamily N-acetyltransferase
MPPQVLLRSGHHLSLEVKRTLSPTRASQIRRLLGHKPGPWGEHIEDYLRNGKGGSIEGLEWRFYLGTIEREVVATICTWEYRGIGILGHVFTHSEWRRLGIADALLEFLEDDFRSRGGRILQLNTDYQSMPYQIYRRRGFLDVPNGPGAMWKFRGKADLNNLFRSAPVRAASFRWRHWPSANLLFLRESPSFVRAAGIGGYGVHSLEGALVHHFPQIWDLPVRERGQAEVLETPKGACVAWASLLRDMNWMGQSRRKVFDLFFHPRFKDRIEGLINRFFLPRGVLAYSTPEDPKNPFLEWAGFREAASFKNHFKNGETLVVYER